MSRIKELEDKISRLKSNITALQTNCDLFEKEIEALKAEEQESNLPRDGQIVEVWDNDDYPPAVIRHEGDLESSHYNAGRWDNWRPYNPPATRVEWSGGENPVGDVLVAYEKRNGITDIQYARGLNWGHCKSLKAHDIVAYWVLEQE